MGAPPALTDSHHHCSKWPMGQLGKDPLQMGFLQLLVLARVRRWPSACGFTLPQSRLISKLGQCLQIQGALIPYCHPSGTEDSPVGAWRHLHSPDIC